MFESFPIETKATYVVSEMYQNNIFIAPNTLQLENFVFNPIATINSCPTEYLIYREEHEIKEAMNTYANEGNKDTNKLIPKDFGQDHKNEKMLLQKNEEKSIIVTKITTYHLKTSTLIDELSHTLFKIQPFGENVENLKLRKFFADFSVRFSRNYIYETERMMDEIRFYYIDHYSYFERSTNHLASKVCNLFAIISRALQIYYKHLINMGNANTDKLHKFMDLALSGMYMCIEMKIFDKNDILIKLLIEKADNFITMMEKMRKEEPPVSDINTLNTLESTWQTKNIHISSNHRYFMYAPKSKKIRLNKAKINFSKTAQSLNYASSLQSSHSSYRDQHFGDANTMFESQIESQCSGNSSASDAYPEVIKQNNISLNDPDEVTNHSLTDIDMQENLLLTRYRE